VVFCLDDFGTGYSSLSYLYNLPIDSFKLDRSFMREIEKDTKSQCLVRNLVSLGDELGLTVVVEGVETAPQARLLQKLGCELAQGFYYHRPLSVADVEKLLALSSVNVEKPAAAPVFSGSSAGNA
jgi:EAL domain-containing protein (putative c-di-GMP-specific phosphodiesterase class I)